MDVGWLNLPFIDLESIIINYLMKYGFGWLIGLVLFGGWLMFGSTAVGAQTVSPTIPGLKLELPSVSDSLAVNSLFYSTFLSKPSLSLSANPSQQLVLTDPLSLSTVTPLPSPSSKPSEQPVVSKTLPATSQPTATPLPSQMPTPTAVPSVTPIPTITPTPASIVSNLSSSGGLDANDLFSMVNAYRQSNGLPVLKTDDRACQVANERAPEVGAEIANGDMHQGLKDLNLPYWNSENIISMRTDQEAFNWWINDPIHKEAILGNYTYSCMACSGNSCAEEFTNFQAK